MIRITILWVLRKIMDMLMNIALSVIIFFMAIALFVIVHVLIMRRAFTRGLNNNNNPPTIVDERSGRRIPNMSLDDIKKLPSFDYKAEEEEGEQRGKSSQMECPVCLESFKVGETCRSLFNCQHIFHAQCIDLWLSKTAICPVCRTDVNLVSSKNLAEAGVENSGEVGVDFV